MVLRNYLKNFKNDFTEKAQDGVFNCLQIIDRARNGDMSGENFSELDLRKCAFTGRSFCNSNLTNAYVSKKLFISQGHAGGVKKIDYSPSGKYIISTGDDNIIKIWNIKTSELIHSFGKHDYYLSPENGCFGNVSVLSSDDGNIKIVDNESDELIYCIERNKGTVVYTNRYPKEDHFVYVTYDADAARIWNSETNILIHTLKEDGALINRILYSSDGGHIVAISDRTIKIWNSNNGNLAFTICEDISNLSDIQLSPNRESIVSISENKAIKKWNIRTGKLTHLLECNEVPIYNAEYSPDGKYISSYKRNSVIKIWDSEAGELKHSLDGHDNNEICDLEYSADGRYIVSASRDGTVVIWDAKSSKPIKEIGGDYEGPLKYMVCSSDWNYIYLFYHRKATIKIWDLEANRWTHSPRGHEGYVKTVLNSPSSNVVAIISDGKTIIWDIKTNEPLFSLEGHIGCMDRVEYSKDRKFIITDCGGGNIIFWNAGTGKLIHNLGSDVNDLKISSDGKYVISFYNDNTYGSINAIPTVYIWNNETGRFLHSLTSNRGNVRDVIFSQDLACVITIVVENENGDTSRYLRTIEIWDIETGDIKNSLNGNDFADLGLIYTHDRRFVITCSNKSGSWKFYNSIDDDVLDIIGGYGEEYKIWDSKTSKLLHYIKGRGLIYSPDGANIAYIKSDSNAIIIIDIKAGKQINSINKCIQSVSVINCSPDGRFIVSVSDSEYDIKIWDSKTGELVRILDEYSSGAAQAYYSPNGKIIVSYYWNPMDGKIKIWDSVTGTLQHTFEGISMVSKVYYSPCGGFIAATFGVFWEGVIKVWNVKTGDLVCTLDECHPVATLFGHWEPINNVSFSPCGKFIVTNSSKQTKIWDIAQGKSIVARQENLANSTYSSCGYFIICANQDIVKTYSSKTLEFIRDEKTNGIIDAGRSNEEIYSVIISDGSIIELNDGKTGYLTRIFPLTTKVLGTNLQDIKHDDLSKNDFLLLKQNGAIVEGVDA